MRLDGEHQGLPDMAARKKRGGVPGRAELPLIVEEVLPSPGDKHQPDGERQRQDGGDEEPMGPLSREEIRRGGLGGSGRAVCSFAGPGGWHGIRRESEWPGAESNHPNATRRRLTQNLIGRTTLLSSGPPFSILGMNSQVPTWRATSLATRSSSAESDCT